LEIVSFDILPSTQIYLTEALRNGKLKAPVAVLALEQTDGVGSRNNTWYGGEGNFFASIALCIDALPSDLPLSSASIYFSFIMKKILKDSGEKIWLKWPNDFYRESDKVGGTITKKIENSVVCGIGINLSKAQNGYSALACDISPEVLLEKYLSALQEFPKWKQVFSEYRVEFEQSRKFSVHIGNERKSLANARLCEDGSLMIEEERVYSLR